MAYEPVYEDGEEERLFVKTAVGTADSCVSHSMILTGLQIKLESSF